MMMMNIVNDDFNSYVNIANTNSNQDFDFMTNNGAYLDSRNKLILAAEREHIKIVLQRKKEQEKEQLQQQQIMLKNSLQQLHNHQPSKFSSLTLMNQTNQVNYQHHESQISKEYILSQLNAQKKQQQQQQQHQQHQQHQQQNQQNFQSLNRAQMINKIQQASNFANIAKSLQVNNEAPNPNFSAQQMMPAPETKNDSFEKLKMLIVKNNQSNQQKFNNLSLNEMNQNSLLTLNNLFNNKQMLKSTDLEQQLQQQHMKSYQINTIQPFEIQQNSKAHQIENNNIEINLDGVIKNIPPNVLLDQFGMLGLSMMINHRDDQGQCDDDVSIMIGKGQASLRFLQKSQTLLQNKNESVLSNQNKSPNECASSDDSDIDNSILAPFENASLLDDYKISSNQLKLVDPNDLLHSHVNEELLFYLFYMCCQDELQHKAYTILCAKNWIYNKEMKIWFKPVSNNNNQQAYDLNSSQYLVFDVMAWEIKLINSINKSKFNSDLEQ